MLSSNHAKFQTTQWSLIATTNRADSQGREATEKLCLQYWAPVYAYIRRRGYQSNDALDLTQDLFAVILERSVFALADPVKGRFRSYLLAATKNFLAEHERHHRAQKRGGGAKVLSIDAMLAEEQFQPVAKLDDAEDAFDRQWANQILEDALRDLDELNREPDRWNYYTHLKDLITSTTSEKRYEELATQFKVSSSAIRVQIHRLRQKFRELLRKRIASTLLDSSELDEELNFLMKCLRGK